MAKYSLNAPYLVLTGVLLIAIVLGAGIYRPLYLQWRSIQVEQAKVQATLAEKNQFLAEIDSKKAQLVQLQPYETELGVLLPNTDRFEDFARIVHQAGVASGVLVNSVNNGSQIEQNIVISHRARGEASGIPDNVLPMASQVQLSGNYQQMRAFIDLLEKSPRLIQIEKLSAKRVDLTTDQLDVVAQLRFYKRDTK